MKNCNLILLLISLFLLHGCDNDRISDEQAAKFVKFYGPGLNDKGMQVVSTQEGYLIVGNIGNGSSGQDVCSFRTDKSGNMLGTMITYGGAFDQLAYSIAPNDSGYIIAGSTQTGALADLDPWVLQIDGEGNSLWAEPRVFSMPGNNEAIDAIVLDNGYIALTGYTDASGDRQILFIRFAGETGAAMIRNYGLPGLNEEAFCLEHISGDLFLLGGYFEQQEANQVTRSLVLLRWWVGSSGGSFIPVPGIDPVNTVAKQSTKTSDGKFLIACDVQVSNATSEILLVMVNAEANKAEWTSTVGERNINLVSSVEFIDDRVYVSGTSSNTSRVGDMMIARMQANGQNPEYSYFGDGTAYEGGGFTLTEDGGYIITGANFVNDKSLITLFKTNTRTSF